jgi:uncharacterized protein
MIGTRLDEVDAPRLIRSEFGWWFIGNQTWTLVSAEGVRLDGTVAADVDAFLHSKGAYRPCVPHTFSLTVLTATACNLGCGYCFQNTALDPSGGNRPLRIERQLLNSDTIDRIIRFTADRMAQAKLDGLYLLLFGGEPLLNRRGCLELLEQARTIGLNSAMVATNGVLLTPKLAKELEARGLTGAQLTFDGSRDDHDRIRVRRSGAATFDTIVRHLAQATEATGLRWHLRVNVSHHNFERIGDLFSQLRAADINPARCTLTFAWVGDAGFGYGNALGHVDTVSDAFVAWSIAALEAGFGVARPSMKTTCQICSVPGGQYGAVVNADGSLYSCWQSAGKPGFEVGTVDAGYQRVSDVRERWVCCGYEYEQGAPAVVAAFQDRVDSRLLDYMHINGRL